MLKKALVVMGICLASLLVAVIVFKTAVAAIIGGIAGAIVGGIVSFFVAKRTTEKVLTDAGIKVTPDPEAELIRRFDNLVMMNIKIREAKLATEVLSLFEEIIDKLRRLLPEMNENYPGNDLTWEVNRTADEYLPKQILSSYLGLTLELREQKKSEILETSGMLKKTLDEIIEMVNGNRVTDFAAKATFIKIRFAR